MDHEIFWIAPAEYVILRKLEGYAKLELCAQVRSQAGAWERVQQMELGNEFK
jgi:hypothetical protein